MVVCVLLFLFCGDVVCEMIDLKLLGGFDFRQTDRQTDERTFVLLKLLSRLKNDGGVGNGGGFMERLVVVMWWCFGNINPMLNLCNFLLNEWYINKSLVL